MNRDTVEKYAFLGDSGYETGIYYYPQNEYADNYYRIVDANTSPIKTLTITGGTVYNDDYPDNVYISMVGDEYEEVENNSEYLINMKDAIKEVFYE